MVSRFRNISYRKLLIACGTVLGMYWISLFVLTHLPPGVLDRFLSMFFSTGGEVLEQGGDKRAHLLAYGGLAFLFTSWLSIRRVPEFKLWTLTIAVLGGYAIVDELSQIPFRRSADIVDCLADWTGVAIGSVCFLGVRLLIGRFGFRHTPTSIEAP